MTHNLQSMMVSVETLAERIKIIECENRTLLNRCDTLIDRIFIQEGTVHAMMIISKEGMLSLTDKLLAVDSSMKAIMSKEEMVSLMDKHYNLESLMKTLEHNTGQEIQELQKGMVSRFNKIEEIIDSDEQEQK